MPFVRVHGNQLAIAHGSRREGKVVQEVLFTLYSKAEAREAIGDGSEGGAAYFERVVGEQHPGITFDWPRLRGEIATKLDHLPETYDHGGARQGRDFREALVAFTRQLLLADPQVLNASAELLKTQLSELEYLHEKLAWRINVARERTPHEFGTDNTFLWRYAAFKDDVPPEVDDEIGGLLERREFDALVPRVKLLVEAFPSYADGFNTLGLVALECGELDDAVRYFERTVEVGRTLFPKRVARDAWWLDLSTRPYMRGLGNIALALNRAGRFVEALAACDELSKCNDPETVAARKAVIFLNQGSFEASAEFSGRLAEMYTESGFDLAFALLAGGRDSEALPHLVRAVANHPRAAKRLLGSRLPKPTTRWDWEGDLLGARLQVDLQIFFATREGRSAIAKLRRLVQRPEIAALIEEVGVLEAREAARRGGEDRTAYDRLSQIRSVEFAAAVATRLADPRGHPHRHVG